MVFARSRKARSHHKLIRRRKTHKHKYTLKGGDKEKACKQFWYSTMRPGVVGGGLDPPEMAPHSNPNIDESELDEWLAFLPTLKKENLLLIVMGDPFKKDILQYHNIKNEEFIKSWSGKITVLIVDPMTSDKGEIDKSTINLDGFDDKIESVYVMKIRFPYSPFPTLTEHTSGILLEGSPIMQMHYGLIPFPYSIKVLNELVKYPSPIFIDSRMASICLRSFKYLIDMRKIKGLQTKAIYEYSSIDVPQVCNDEYPVFPRPLTACDYFNESGNPSEKLFEKNSKTQRNKTVKRWHNRGQLKKHEDFLEDAATKPNFNVLEEAKKLGHRGT